MKVLNKQVLQDVSKRFLGSSVRQFAQEKTSPLLLSFFDFKSIRIFFTLFVLLHLVIFGFYFPIFSYLFSPERIWSKVQNHRTSSLDEDGQFWMKSLEFSPFAFFERKNFKGPRNKKKANHLLSPKEFSLLPVFSMNNLSRYTLEKRVLKNLPLPLQERLKSFLGPTLFIAEKYRLDPFWILSIMWVESHYDSKARSHKGARGLMQIMPTTANVLTELMTRLQVFPSQIQIPFRRLDPLPFNFSETKNPLHAYLMNIEMGAFYLRYLLDLFEGDHNLATIAYNRGPFRVQKILDEEGRGAVENGNRYLQQVKKAYSVLTKDLDFGPPQKI